MQGLNLETSTLLLASACYAIATAFALARPAHHERRTLALLAIGLASHTASLAARWIAVGHGPFTTMYEILSSNVWSLTLIFALAFARSAMVRAGAIVVLPILFVMTAWMLVSDAGPGHLPATYATPLLYVHTFFGKLFLGLVLIAVGLAGVVLLRRIRAIDARFAAIPPSERLDELAYRFAAAAFVFQTLMLVAGAIWAQDAWGRYWAWDPLETWAFLTWIALAFALHVRGSARPAPHVNAGLVIAVFALAFLTFFGVPFVSTAPHKGAV